VRSPWRWAAPVTVAAIVLTATSIPRLQLPDGPSDKQWHFAGYAALGVALGWARGGPWRRHVASLAGLVAFGAVDELHQRWIPGRAADVADWFADSAGSATGLALIAALTRRQESPS
jgi:VanZ family protein